jgi:hypothetical protein
MCRNNPCTCASVNCACPPNYSVTPVVTSCPSGTTCEDTILTSCVFTTQYLSCSKVPAGTNLDITLATLDAKLCQCGSCSGSTIAVNTSNATYDGTGLPCIGVSSGTTLNTVLSDIDTKLCSLVKELQVYYVDGNNTVAGDGSVINPFKTLEQAYNKIIGTGSVVNPQNSNVGVSVAAAQYTTSQNIYTPGITWDFATNTEITFDASGSTNYFVDTSILNGVTGVQDFIITGELQFSSTTGGFINNVGAARNTDPVINVTATIYSINCQVPTTSGNIPVINLSCTSSGNLTPSIKISITNGGVINSQNQHVFSLGNTNFGGGYLDVEGNNGQISLKNSALLNKNILYYSCLTGHNNDSVVIRNISIASSNINDIFYVTGAINTFQLDTIQLLTPGLKSSFPKPNTFLNLNNTSITLYDTNQYTFFLKDVYLDSYNLAAGNVITYTSGLTTPTFDYLDMSGCVLFPGCTISNNINLGKISQGNISKSTSSANVVNGYVHFTQVPNYSTNTAAKTAGLVTGDVYQNSGQLMVVF